MCLSIIIDLINRRRRPYARCDQQRVQYLRGIRCRYICRYLPPTGTRMYVELPARTYKGVFSRYIYYCSLNKRWTRVRVIYYIRSQPFLFFRNWGVYVADEAAAQLWRTPGFNNIHFSTASMILYTIHIIYFNNRVRATCSILGVICICCISLVLQSPRSRIRIFPRPILFYNIYTHNTICRSRIYIIYNPRRAPDDTQRFSRNSSNVIPFLGIDIIICWSYYLPSSCCARLIPNPPHHHHHHCSPIDYTTLTAIVSTFCYYITDERTDVASRSYLTLHRVYRYTPPRVYYCIYFVWQYNIIYLFNDTATITPRAIALDSRRHRRTFK